MIFCGLVKKNLTIAICPLKNGHCMWKHRKSAECCYTSDDLTKEEFCALVGIEKVPSDEELQNRQKTLQDLLLKDNYENPTLDS